VRSARTNATVLVWELWGFGAWNRWGIIGGLLVEIISGKLR